MEEKTLVVIPTYNEEENIQPLVQEIFKFAPKVSLLFVDDQSKDQTRAKISEASAQFPGQINILKRSKKLGLGSAYIAGFQWGLSNGFQVLIEMDADLSHNPKYLPNVLKQLQKNDVVICSRYVDDGGTKDWGLIRRVVSRFGSFYARFILGFRVMDFTGGFNAWHARVLKSIKLEDIESNGYVFQIELKYRAILSGFSFKEIPIIFADRQKGESKMSLSIVFEAIYMVFLLRLRRSLHTQELSLNERG